MAYRAEEPCLTNNLAWLDEARENNDRDFLNVTAFSNKITSIAVDNESREKRQMVYCSSADKGKGSIVVMWMRLGMIPII